MEMKLTQYGYFTGIICSYLLFIISLYLELFSGLRKILLWVTSHFYSWFVFWPLTYFSVGPVYPPLLIMSVHVKYFFVITKHTSLVLNQLSKQFKQNDFTHHMVMISKIIFYQI